MIPLIVFGVVAVIVAGVWTFIPLQQSNKSSGLPIIWWYVDDGEANTKSWASFEDRATYDPVEPYLSLCLDRARSLWSSTWDIRPIIGRRAALALLKFEAPPGVIRAPPAIWMAWFRATLLARQGGLWMDGSILPLADGETLRRRIVGHQVLTFGTDSDVAVSASQDPNGQGSAAGNSAGWSAFPSHPMWVGLSKAIGSIVAAGSPSFSAFDNKALWATHCSGVTLVDRGAELSRTLYGKQLDYLHLFDCNEVTPDIKLDQALWLPLPFGRDSFERKIAYQWFTRLSKQQINESEFVWAKLAR